MSLAVCVQFRIATMTKKKRTSPLEDGFIVALRAIDNQIAREMQRSPEDLESHGVRKWEPHSKRVETVTALLLNAVGQRQVDLDSLIVSSQAFVKALRLFAEELDGEGLGHVRAEYVKEAFQRISDDAFKGVDLLRDDEPYV